VCLGKKGGRKKGHRDKSLGGVKREEGGKSAKMPAHPGGEDEYKIKKES